MEAGGALFGSALVLVLVVAGLGLHGAHLLRRQSRRLQVLMDHRMDERERAFAELHDALLQDVQGLTLSLQAIADQMPPDAPARRRLEHALDRADELLAQGRERVRRASLARDALD
jgi:signal transduction histidine kinase